MVSNLGQNHVKKKTKGKNKQNPSSIVRDVAALAYSSSSTTFHAFLFKQLDEDSLCSAISPPSLVNEDSIAMSSSSLPQRYHSTSGDTRSWETTSGDTRSPTTTGKPRSLAVVQAMVKWFAPMRFWLAFLYNISADMCEASQVWKNYDSYTKLADDFGSILTTQTGTDWNRIMTAACKRFMTTPYIELDLDGKIADFRSKTPILFVSDSIGLLKAISIAEKHDMRRPAPIMHIQLRRQDYDESSFNARIEADRRRD